MAEADPAAGRPVALIVLDGWGWRDEAEANAVRLADTPVFDRLWADGPHAFLRTDGPQVGLPEGQFGNSEVGHTTLGAGRVLMQDLPRVDRALADGSLAASAAFARLVDGAMAGSKRVHLVGLISPGGVHGHQAQAAALARLLAERGLEVVVHAVTDGRDTPPRSAVTALEDFEAALAGAAGVRIATVSGRFYAMDRDHRWERVELAWRAMALGEAPGAASWRDALAASYAAGAADEFVEPRCLGGYTGIADGDALLCTNFRADRVRELLAALVVPGFDGFARGCVPCLSVAAGLTAYGAEVDAQLVTLLPPQPEEDRFGQLVARAGLAQLRLAETEKYPHVTFFFNGGQEAPEPGEERLLVPSPKVATYDLAPEMSALPLTERAVAAIGTGKFDFVLLNFANADMVGHTGVLAAAIAAVTTVDACLGRVLAAIAKAGGVALVTADHGNAELMTDPETGEPHTAHTLNPVPCMLVGGPAGRGLRDAGLADVAPTLLELLGLPQPVAMTGRSLLTRST